MSDLLTEHMHRRAYGGLSALSPEQELAIGRCIAADMDAHPDTPEELAARAVRMTRNHVARAVRELTEAQQALAREQHDLERDLQPLRPGFVLPSVKRVDQRQRDLAGARAALDAALGLVREGVAA